MDPYDYAADSAQVQHAVASGIDIPCSIIPRQSSGIPRSQYKSRIVCLKE